MLQAERTSGGNTIAECLRCGCFFAYHRKPKTDANGNPIELPVDHIEKGGAVPCPGCGYYPKSLLAKGKAVTFFSLLFLAVFPALMLMFAKPLSSQAHLISDDTADTVFNLCLYAAMGIAGVALVAAFAYHPTRPPFKRWEKQAKLLKEGRPKDQWVQPQESPPAPPLQQPPPPAAAPAADLSVDDIAPPADFVPPKTRDDDDEEEEAAAALPLVPAAATAPRPMPRPHGAAGAPVAAGKSTEIVLQCPQCHKKFRVPREVLAQAPKCKACHVPLNEVTGKPGAG